MKLTRRDLVKMSAGAAAFGLGGGWSALSAGSGEMIEVTIPSSGRKVPAVGIGTVKFRGCLLYTSDAADDASSV